MSRDVQVAPTLSHEPASVSTSLLERLRARDTAGWQRFAQLYGPLLYAWCRRAGLQPADAADVAQEVFSSLLAGVANFRRDRPADSFRGWLWTISQNKIRDHFRRREQAQGGSDAQQCWAQLASPDSDLSDTTPHPDERALLTQRVLELVRAGIEDRTWQAFWRVTIESQDVAAVARELGMTAPAVYKAKYRVLRLIREARQELPDQR